MQFTREVVPPRCKNFIKPHCSNLAIFTKNDLSRYNLTLPYSNLHDIHGYSGYGRSWKCQVRNSSNNRAIHSQQLHENGLRILSYTHQLNLNFVWRNYIMKHKYTTHWSLFAWFHYQPMVNKQPPNTRVISNKKEPDLSSFYTNFV